MAKKPAVKAKSKGTKPAAKIQAKVAKNVVKLAEPVSSEVVVTTVKETFAEKLEQKQQAPAPIVKPLRMPVETAKPAQGVWSKLFGSEGQKPEKAAGGDVGMRENLAAVKAGVMQELETMSAEKGMPLKGSPFRTVVLPQMRRKRSPWMGALLAGIVLVFVVVMVMVASRPADPAVVIGRALTAMRDGNVMALERDVDVGAVTESVVNQVFVAPQMNVDVLPPVLRKQMQKEGGAHVDAMIKPGLAETLKDDVLASVKSGGVDTGRSNLLAKLWRDLGGGELKAGTPRVAMQDDRMVVAELPLHRMDLGVTLPLQVVMNKGDGGSWRVVDVPNFSAVLDSFVAAGKQHGEVETAASDVDKLQVEISKVRKAKGGDGSLVVGMAVANKGTRPVRGLRLNVQFGDAAGQPMKSVVLTVDDELAPGQVRERVWTVPVDVRKPVERYVRDLPLSALTVKVVPLVGGADKRVELLVPEERVAL